MKWNVDRLVERYYDGDAEKIFKDSGIANPKNSKRNTNQSKKQLDECTICFNLYSPSEGTELPCGHSFCNNCWREYLTFKIMDEGKAKVITCPAKGCHMLVDEVTVGKLITDPKVRDKYVQMIAQAYVEVRTALLGKTPRILLLRFTRQCKSNKRKRATTDTAPLW